MLYLYLYIKKIPNFSITLDEYDKMVNYFHLKIDSSIELKA